MVVEGAFGQLKGRWRVLMRKNEWEQETFKIMSLACIVLHNICIDLDNKMSKNLDYSYDLATNQRRSSDEVKGLLQMTYTRKVADTCKHAIIIRETLSNMFWTEKENYGNV